MENREDDRSDGCGGAMPHACAPTERHAEPGRPADVPSIPPEGCTVTVLRAPGRRLCKTRHADGTVRDYDAAKLLDLHAAHVPDLPALAKLLENLLARQ